MDDLDGRRKGVCLILSVPLPCLNLTTTQYRAARDRLYSQTLSGSRGSGPEAGKDGDALPNVRLLIEVLVCLNKLCRLVVLSTLDDFSRKVTGVLRVVSA